MEYRGFTLDRFQEEAIGHLHEGRNVLVAAPTGTGKTVVADWIVDEALSLGRSVIYTAPIKALSNQKFRDYTRLYGTDRVGLVTGDLVIRRDAPCLVMTTEILRNMLLAGDPMSDLHAVVIDEVHFLDDRERGTVWEEVLIYLPKHVKVVALSATLPNLEEFREWLEHVRGSEVAIVTETKRAVPLSYQIATREAPLMSLDAFAAKAAKHRPTAPAVKGHGRDRERGRDRQGGRPGSFGERTSPIDVFKLVRKAEGLPLMYFVFSRQDAERFATQLAFRFNAELLTEDELAQVDAAIDRPELSGVRTSTVLRMLRQGIAFHHAGLHVQLKAIVEELYEQKLVKALFCTSTFALGINMPARTVCFHGLMKFDGESTRPLPTRGFMQKAGRAGRRGMDDTGRVVIRMDYAEYEQLAPVLDRYRKQAYEPVRSAFSLSWNSIVNLLERHDLDQVKAIVDKSFMSWHFAKKAREQVEHAERLEAERDAGRGSVRAIKDAKRARARAANVEDVCWSEFLAKRAYLVRVGYLAEDDTFLAGARVLKHVQIAEILVTELVLGGILEDLDDATLFGLLVALTNDVPRSVTIGARPSRKDREFLDKVDRLRHGPAVAGAEVLARVPVTFSPELFQLGRGWAEGASLERLLADVDAATDWSGTLITGFRRAKDLLGQLVDVYAELPDRAESLRRLSARISRDEVEVID